MKEKIIATAANSSHIKPTFDRVSGPNDKAKKSKASTRLYIRLTVEEKTRLEQLAGNKTISAYVRDKALGEHVKKRQTIRKPQMEDMQYAMLLSSLGESRLSANINQLAKHANMGTLGCSEQVEEQLQEACAALFAMRNALFLALGHRPKSSEHLI